MLIVKNCLGLDKNGLKKAVKTLGKGGRGRPMSEWPTIFGSEADSFRPIPCLAPNGRTGSEIPVLYRITPGLFLPQVMVIVALRKLSSD
jgi:hypothetical protein